MHHVADVECVSNPVGVDHEPAGVVDANGPTVQRRHTTGQLHTHPLADRDELVAYATKAWAELQPDAQVLTARIPSQAWTRDTRWEWSNGAFYKIDASKVQVQLIVKHDDTLAVIRPVNLYKNHLKGDTVNAYPMDAIDEDLLPQRYLMLEKVK